MYGEHDHAGGRRIAAGIATLAIHAVIAAGLILGLASGDAPRRGEDDRLVTVDLDTPPPPPPESEPASPAKSRPAPEGAKGNPLPREAPVAAIPLAVAPAAPVAGEGADAASGASSQGNGAGAGGTGSGGGGDGGLASPARRIAGALRDSDYPRAAEADGLAGTVGIGFRVRTDGRVDRCTVVRSSGSALLDNLTCSLFTARYRFRPATDASGAAIESSLQTSFTWGTRRRR
jgi:protein TonB